MRRREYLAAGSGLLTTGLAGCSAPVADGSDGAGEPGSTGPGGDVRMGESGDAVVDAISSWPMFLHGRTHQRSFTTTEKSVGDPTQRWTREAGEAVWSSPVVADGTLYVGSYDGHLYALDADTGEIRWRYRTGDRIDGSPAVANGTVYVGSFDRNIYALDAETGAERWMHGTRGVVRSSPTVVGDTVYIGAFCRSEECNAYYDVSWPKRGFLYALDADTGSLRWRYRTDDGVVSTPAVHDGAVFVGSSDSRLYAFDATTGERRWQYETAGPVMSSPTVVDGRVYVGNVAGRLYSLAPEDGTLDWSFAASKGRRQGVELPVAITGSPVVSDGTLYVGTMFPGDELVGKLLAVSATTGDREWTVGPFGQAVGSSPLCRNGTLFFGAHTFGPSPGHTSGIYAVDTGGSVRWRFTVPPEHEGFGSSPAVVDSTLYIGGTGGTVYAFDL